MYSSYYYDVSPYAREMDSAASVGLGAAIGSMIGVYSVIVLIIAILQIIANWKIFTKAGEAGWKSIIPIYNLVILFRISGLSPWILLAYLTAFIPVIGWIVSVVISVLQANGLSKSFGKSTGFTVGLFFLPSIFYMILGFGSSQYIGKINSDKDVVDVQ